MITVKAHHLDYYYLVSAIPEHQEYKEKLLNYFDGIPESTNEEKNGYVRITKYDFLLLHEEGNRPWIDWFTPVLTSFLQKFPVEIGYQNPVIEAMWFQQYNYKDMHNWHLHNGANWAGIYYVEVPDNSVITDYVDPFTRVRKQFECKEGDVVIFPASLQHSSPINLTSGRKTVVAFNLNFQWIAD